MQYLWLLFVLNLMTSLSYYILTSLLLFVAWKTYSHPSFQANNIVKRQFLCLIFSLKLLFASFIALCGGTHTLGALEILYDGQGSFNNIKVTVLFLCAIVSLMTAIISLKMFPLLLQLLKKLELTEEGKVRLCDAVESCQESIVTISSDFVILRGNAITESYFGKNFVGASILDFLINPEDAFAFKKTFNNLISADITTDSVTVKYQVKGGIDENNEQCWLESSLKKCRIGNSSSSVSVFAITMVTRNIDAAKKAEIYRSMLDARREQDAINEAKLRYITCIAHDLKTPLQTFCLALDLLIGTELGEDQKDLLHQATVAVELMKLTISQSIHIGKTLSGNVVAPRKSTVSISEVINRVRVIMNGYGPLVPITYDVSETIYDSIITDEEWISQMLLNLLTNASKYTVEGNIAVTVEVTDDNNELLFQVCDTGVGISDEKLDTVFDAFNQAQLGQSQGSGLGLFGLRTRVEALGGCCGVRHNTQASSGSIFWFKIPYTKDIADEVRPESSHRELPTKISYFRNDDNNTNDTFHEIKVAESPSPVELSRFGVSHLFSSKYSQENNRTISDEYCNTSNPMSSYHPKNTSSTSGSHSFPNSPLAIVDTSIHSSPRKKRFSSSSGGSLASRTFTPTPNSNLPGRSSSPLLLHKQSVTTTPPLPLPATTTTTTTTDANKSLTSAFVVDDSLTIRKVMTLALKKLGFQDVTCFENGAAALQAMKEKQVDLVFTDVLMPVMSGPELAIRFRQFEDQALLTGTRSHRQKIVAITANKSEELSDMVPTALDYICSKPIDMNELFRIIEHTRLEDRQQYSSSGRNNNSSSSSSIMIGTEENV